MMTGENVQFYGAVTVSDRGQVVIPAQARRDLDIKVGEKMLVVGGPGGGLLFLQTDVVSRMLTQWADLIRLLEEGEFTRSPAEETSEET
jgi:AbrB family looped-hinge helix DNA binding protein